MLDLCGWLRRGRRSDGINGRVPAMWHGHLQGPRRPFVMFSVRHWSLLGRDGRDFHNHLRRMPPRDGEPGDGRVGHFDVRKLRRWNLERLGCCDVYGVRDWTDKHGGLVRMLHVRSSVVRCNRCSHVDCIVHWLHRWLVHRHARLQLLHCMRHGRHQRRDRLLVLDVRPRLDGGRRRIRVHCSVHGMRRRLVQDVEGPRGVCVTAPDHDIAQHQRARPRSLTLIPTTAPRPPRTPHLFQARPAPSARTTRRRE